MSANPAAGVLVLLVALFVLLRFLSGSLDSLFGWTQPGTYPVTPGFGGGSSDGSGGAGGSFGPAPTPTRPTSSGLPMATA